MASTKDIKDKERETEEINYDREWEWVVLPESTILYRASDELKLLIEEHVNIFLKHELREINIKKYLKHSALTIRIKRVLPNDYTIELSMNDQEYMDNYHIFEREGHEMCNKIVHVRTVIQGLEYPVYE